MKTIILYIVIKIILSLSNISQYYLLIKRLRNKFLYKVFLNKLCKLFLYFIK